MFLLLNIIYFITIYLLFILSRIVLRNFSQPFYWHEDEKILTEFTFFWEQLMNNTNNMKGCIENWHLVLNTYSVATDLYINIEFLTYNSLSLLWMVSSHMDKVLVCGSTFSGLSVHQGLCFIVVAGGVRDLKRSLGPVNAALAAIKATGSFGINANPPATQSKLPFRLAQVLSPANAACRRPLHATIGVRECIPLCALCVCMCVHSTCVA